MDYYKTLELSNRKSSKEEIKKNYYKLSKQWHPDRHTNEEDKQKATKKFQEISEAYSVLSDDRKRSIYDLEGFSSTNSFGPPADIVAKMAEFLRTNKWNRYGGSGSGSSGSGGASAAFSKMFENFGLNSPQKTVLIQHVKVKLLTFYLGGIISFNINMKIKCNECSGTGSDNPHKITICSLCNGRGKIQRTKTVLPGMTATEFVNCNPCNGNGKIIPPDHMCKKCKGTRHIIGPSFIEFTVEKGSNYGTYVIENKGDYLDNGLRGDIKLILVPDENDKKEYCFERRDDDLIMEKKLSLREALLGFNFMIKHLDPNNEWLEFNSVKPICPGTVKMLPGYGMPKFNSNLKGAMIISFIVEFPKVIDPELRTKLDSVLPVDSSESSNGGVHSELPSFKPEGQPSFTNVHSGKIININIDNVYSLEEMESTRYKHK